MRKHLGLNGFSAASLLGAALFLTLSTGCVQQERYKEALAAAENYKKSYEGLHAYQIELESRNRDLETQLAKAHVEGAEGQAVYQEASALREEYKRRVMGLDAHFNGIEGWTSGDVEIFSTPEGEVYRIKDAILFDSGSDTIKSNGKKLIAEIAAQINAEGKRIRVEGHTDNDPVVKHKDKFPYGNLQLSSARALQVAHLLIAEGKISPGLLSIAGFGEFRPVAPNDTTENKRKNRRVEIVVVGGAGATKPSK